MMREDAGSMARTELEQQVQQIWADVLGLPAVQISVHDHLTELGGDSLRAMEVLRAIELRLGTGGLNLRTLFDFPTIAQLAEQMERVAVQTSGSKACERWLPIGKRQRQDSYELQRGQKGLWISQQIDPDSCAYNEPIWLELRGVLDAPALEAALQEVVQRHEVLRTVMVTREGEPEQVVLDHLRVELTAQDLRTLSEEEVHRRFEAELRTPFDLSRAPLFRTSLWQVDEQTWQLVLILHHIIFDGTSVELLLREVAALYNAQVAGEAAVLPELPVQYVDYAHWQSLQREQAGWRATESYWLDRLQALPPPLDLPSDWPRPAVRTGRGDVLQVPLPNDLVSGLRQLGREQNATLYMVMLTAYLAWLHRMTHQQDLVIGVPLNERSGPEVQHLLGYFINALPIRVNVTADMRLSDLLSKVKQRVTEAVEHRAYPFDQLVERLNPDRDPSRPLLYSTVFNLLTMHQPELTGLTAEVLKTPRLASNSDMHWLVWEQTADVRIELEYNPDLFVPETMQVYAAQYQHVLRALLQDLSLPVAEIDLLTDKERALYRELSEHKSPFAAEKTIQEVFYEVAAKFSDRPAVSDERQMLTFRELNERSNQLAHALRERGVGTDSIVGLLFGRDAEMIVAILGVLKAGGAYLAFDLKAPAERIQYMSEDSGLRVLVTQQSLAVQRPDAETIFMEEIGQYPTADLDVTNAADDLAYVIYTSGSTGRPKGTLLCHRNVVNLVTWNQRRHELSEHDVMLQSMSTHFDVSVEEIFTALLLGSRLHVLTDEERSSTEAFVQAIAREGATQVMTSYALFQQFAQDLRPEQRPLWATMRRLMVGGEALRPAVVRAWRQKVGDHVRLFNVYGPTETTVSASIYEVQDVAEDAITIPIGQPLANLEMYVLDPQMRLCPVNVVGELYIGGVSLARGYLNQPERTAASFVPHPFRPDARVYQTGDLVRLLPSGYLDYVGRRDAQVKVRGHRIELGEIEATMYQLTGVEEAAVLVRQAVDGNNSLIAFVKMDGEVGDLRKHLAAHLPPYMVPPQIVRLESLPLTSNGKVDRQALLQQADDAVVSHASETDTNRTPLQQRVATIWADVLQIQPEQIGAEDTFFTLGGHSLLLNKVQAQLKEEFRLHVPITDLFKYPTIASLAEKLAQDAPVTINTRQVTSVHEGEAVAIIGMAVRFPEANTPLEFWHNLRTGRESVREFPLDELEPGHRSSRELRDKMVRMSGYVEDIDQFEPEFFQITEKEAELMDPQHRLFLECAWEAIEDAGYNVDAINAPVSVYAGVGSADYLTLAQQHVRSNSDFFQASLASQWDFMATRVSYKLNLKGESMVLSTACSSSLVAVHVACQNLIEGRTDYALAGGASLQIPQKQGYLYEPGFIMSRDGHCRAFDKDASGTAAGNGVGVVLLKRLSDAERDGDPIYAVIRGSATNNDGNEKVSYSAPSPQGQAEVIAEAQVRAGVHPEQISYVETHGAGTLLGDPIEVTALTDVFRTGTDRKQYCGIGSVKTNIGHLNAASGIAGLIKVALSLTHHELPPSLHFNEPNPEIDFENSPFYVNASHQEWKSEGGTRFAGVSSFGMGGTNVHMILEEAPQRVCEVAAQRQPHLFPLSARTLKSLRQALQNLQAHVEREPQVALADLAYTLQMGRREFEYRTAVVAEDAEQLVERLERAWQDLDAGSQRELQAEFAANSSRADALCRELETLFAKDDLSNSADLLQRLAELWMTGTSVNWQSLHQGEPRNRVHAPTYAFDRQSYWMDIDMTQEAMWQQQAPAQVAVTSDQSTANVLAQFWREVLGVSEVGPSDNFFDIGGNSLNMLQVKSRIYNVLGIDIELEEMFDSPSLDELINYVEVLQHFNSELDANRILPVAKRDAYPLSHAQMRLWFLMRMDPANTVYNLPLQMMLSGPLDLLVLQRALDELVMRHSMMRTRFIERDGVPMQVIEPDGTFPLQAEDGSHLSESEQQAQLQQIMAELVSPPFDLSAGPLQRAVLYKAGETKFYLCMCMHHIIGDGWSSGVFFRELGDVYQALMQGKQPQLPSISVQYADFAVWQEEQMQRGGLDQHEDYWLHTLAQPLPVLDLPLDFERPAWQSYDGHSFRHRIEGEVYTGLLQLAERQGVTPYMVLLSSYFLLLHQLTYDEDIIIGTPSAGRVMPELEPIFGCFANTLAIRARIDEQQTFLDLLQQVKKRSLEAIQHEAYPFDLLIQKLNPERETSRAPVFSTMFNYQNASTSTSLGDLELSYVPLASHTSLFDLTLYGNEREQGFDLTFEYNTALFREETVARFAERFEAILRVVAEQAGQALHEMNQLTVAERTILQNMNETERAYDLEQTLLDSFVKQAQTHPERIAVTYEGESLTYGELLTASNRLAQFLRRQGVQPNQTVAVLTERSLEMIVALYGVLTAGAAYVPIDPDYPEERVQYMLSDSGSSWLVTKRAHVEAVAGLGTAQLQGVVLLDAEAPVTTVNGLPAFTWQEVQQCPNAAPEPIHTSADLAYMIYTSGSTGRPKGVKVTHRAIVNSLTWMQEQFGLDQQDVVGQRATFCFDISLWELFWPLREGARMVIFKADVVKDQNLFHQRVVEAGVTVLTFVPTLFAAYVYALDEMPPARRSLSALRWVLLCGEPVTVKSVRTWYDLYPHGARVVNLYGPTEAAIAVTSTILTGEERTISIGRPMPNVQLYVLDEQQRPCGVGVAGELYIGGVQLAAGYHNQPDKTAAAFLPMPSAVQKALPSATGDLLYRTGDLARVLQDGSLEHLGRSDYQVKVRGYRIEPEEIDAVLLQHPAVEMATVIAAPGPDGAPVLHAFYTTPHTVLTTADLRAYLTAQLPAYMMPTWLHAQGALPLTPNGKIDRQSLVQRATASQFQPSREFIAPVTPTQTTLAQIWAAILKRESVSLSDHFFEIGGHSLLATQVLNRLQKELGVTIQLKDVFQYATLEQMASHVDRLLAAGQVQAQVEITRLPDQAHYELSHAQKRLWILHKFDPASNVYNAPFVIRIDAEVNVGVFEAALHRLIQRHDSLRTIFCEVDDVPRQVVQTEIDFQMEYYDVSESVREEQLDFITATIAANMNEPFDLTQGPLMRAILFKRGTSEYQFFLNLHHIITDGWSHQLFLRDLTTAYGALLTGDEPEWEALAVRYVDFAAWQNQALTSGMWQQQEEYLLNTFAGPLPVLELPTDYPRPPILTFNGDGLMTTVPPEIATQLRALSKQEDISFYMLMLAAYVMLLHHLTADDDIIVGTPVAGRSVEALEPLIGFFINTVAIRTRLHKVQSLQDLLREVKQQFLSAYDSQAYPFDLLIEKLNPDRNTGRSPLFSAMFTLQSAEGMRQEDGVLPCAEVAEGMGQHTISKFDLTLFVRESADELILMFEYNTDLFKRETMERFEAILQNVLRAFVTQLQAPLGTLDLLTASDQASYAQLNATKQAFDLDTTIHQVFSEHAALHPDRIAVTGEHGAMTYGELNARSNQLAHLLREKGVGANEIVGIMMDRSVDVIIAMLGILKSGGAYTAIDKAYPHERVQYMLADSGMRWMLVDDASGDRLPASDCAILRLSDVRDDLSTEDLAVCNTPHDPAYVIYTSGSTGLPKGTLVPHQGVVNLAQWTRDEFAIDDSDIFLQFASYSFDASVWEIFAPLLIGARVHVLTDAQRLSLEQYSAAVERSGATQAYLPTAFLSQLAMHLSEDEVRNWATMKRICVGGEAVQAEIFRQWQQRFGERIELVNVYGPTEATVYTTFCRIRSLTDLPAAMPTVPIGRPLANVEVCVMNRHMQLCPVNVPGELCIEGVSLAQGYLNQPDRTAAAFVPHPLQPGRMLYKTGDLVRLLASGEIEFITRRDTQVKVRGYRVEIGEIEACLLQHADIESAAVIAGRDASGSHNLTAFYVAAGGADLSADAVRTYLTSRLPGYMVPVQMVSLAQMPLTPNDKIDRQALAQRQDANALDFDQEFVAPSTPTEQKLARIWASIFRRERISATDHFFDLGGHSLLAIQLMNRIRKDLRVMVEMKDLFAHATLEQLAALVEDAGARPAVQIARQPVQAHYELSHAQKRLWFLYKIDPAKRVYDVANLLHYKGVLDVPAFEAALQHVVNRHDALRTLFYEIDGEPRQVVQTECEFPLEFRDVSGLAATEQRDYMRLKIDELDGQPFDLAVGPLLRAILFRLGADEYRLYLNMHHIITDGWSLDVLFADLSEAYQALVEGYQPLLEPLAVQVADYATWQNAEHSGEKGRAREEFWLSTMTKPLPVLELPTDYARPEVMTFNGDTVRAAVPHQMAEQLRVLSKQEDVSFFMLMLAAYVMLLHHLTEDEDIIVGTPVAGRTVDELEPLIGFFVNTLAIRTRLDGVASLHDLLQVVKGQFLDAYEHQSYPFDLLVEKVNPDRDPSRTPLFSTMFTYQTGGTAEPRAGVLDFRQADEGMVHTISKFDLTLMVIDTPEELLLAFEYNTDLFKRATVERFEAAFQNVLQAFATRVSEPLAQLDLLSAADQECHAALNGADAVFEAEKTIHEAFYEQAALHPNRAALSDAEGVLTFAEVNVRSNQLAHVLREKGVGTNHIVGIMMDRSKDVIVAMLGVLKAGAAYVPLDPEYPAERVRFMLTDSGANVVLTEPHMKSQLLNGQAHIETLCFSDIPSDTSTDNLPIYGTAQNLAYVIYTSGSTGQPKGTLLRHIGVANLTQWKREEHGYSESDVIVQYASYSFDASVWEVFPSLLNGAQVHVLRGEQRTTITAFADAVATTRATGVTLPTVFFNQLGHYLSDADAEKLTTLKRIFVAGEALQPEVVRAWQRRFGTRIEIINAYGPTEATVCATTCRIRDLLADDCTTIPIGHPISGTAVYVLNRHLQLAPVHVPGELYIEGAGVALGYLNQPEKTAAAFLPHPFKPGSVLYKTGDIARLLPSGEIEYIGRRDAQVKVRGYRVEIGEIEEQLLQHPAVHTAAVITKRDVSGNHELIACYTAQGTPLAAADLRAYLAHKLPAFMLPAQYVQLAELPLLPNGKVDRTSLLTAKAQESTAPQSAASRRVHSRLQDEILAVWAQVLDRDPSEIDVDDNFFEIGGHSLLLVKIQEGLKQSLQADVPLTDLFKYTSIRLLVAALDGTQAEQINSVPESLQRIEQDGVAIIGIGLRYPEATTTYEFWDNLRAGKELIKEIAPEDVPFPLDEMPPDMRARLVMRGAYVEDIEAFDREFFGMTQKETSELDPQQRLFLTCAWEAIENAGYNVDAINARVSLYAGISDHTYQSTVQQGDTASDHFQSSMLRRQFLATRVSHKLNLQGESMVIDTACSTSLVAVHMACQSLLSGQAEYALAGGACIHMPQRAGYVYEPGMILSPDGRCRAFDQDAGGTLPGDGVGVVLLKRLSDALRDGDPVYAVIRGSAINNDGNVKGGYTAPSQRGQADVIKRAQAMAGVDPATIGYIEAHGTGTPLGDPIEVAALREAFGPQAEQHYCAIGSVKTNLGHTDTAAGVTSLIKAALAIKYGELVPSLHFRAPNPACGLENSPFYVNTTTKPWQNDKGPRRAGVSAFGIGGTNAHVILEEGPSDEA